MPTSTGNGNQTTGLGLPFYVQVSGTGIVAAGVDLTNQDPNPSNPTNPNLVSNAFANVGQGHGASAGGNAPNAQYSLTLSLAGKTYNGVAYPSSTTAIAALVDAQNNSVLVSEYENEVFDWVAYCAPGTNAGTYFNRTNSFVSTNAAPASGSPAYPGVKPIITLGTPTGTYEADVLITAGAVGQCVIEVAYPFADNDLTNDSDDGYNATKVYPHQAVTAKITVTVVA